MLTRLGLLLVFATLAGCNGEVALFVDLKTDLVPGQEFVRTAVAFEDGARPEVSLAASRETSYVDGTRIAEIEGLEAGSYALTVALLDGAGQDVSRRRLRVEVESNRAVTVVVTRDCSGVSCPASGGNPFEAACLAGQCVDEACVEENVAACGEPECVVDADCPTSDCADGTCVAGACLLSARNDACMPGRGCHPERGCPPRGWFDTGVTSPGITEVGAAYHTTRQTMVFYGGRLNGFADDPLEQSAAMWEWDGNELSTLCDPCDPGPVGRHALVYDSARDVVVLFGGQLGDGSLSDAHWEWDGLTWTQITAPGNPPALAEAASGYDDARSVVVLYGGVLSNVDDSGRLFEYDGTLWTDATPTAGPLPPPRGASRGAWVAGTGFVFYGGKAEERLDDAWAWDGTMFVRLCETCSGIPRSSAVMVVDSSTGTLFMIGGYDGRDEIAGTWDFDFAAGRFVLLDPEQPPRRDSMGTGYDPLRDVVVFYGGNGGSCSGIGGNCAELYEYRR